MKTGFRIFLMPYFQALEISKFEYVIKLGLFLLKHVTNLGMF